MATEYEIIPSPDFLHRKKIEEAIKNNGGYCPCKIDKNEDTLCICKEFRDSNKSGYCHCGRYYKVLKSPKVCLCGSTRFKDKFFEVAKNCHFFAILLLSMCFILMLLVRKRLTY